MLIDLKDQALIADPDCSLKDLESFGAGLAGWQKGLNFWLGDLAIIAERRFPGNAEQVFPEWISPGLVARCKAVAEAFPPEDRNPLATWSQHRDVKNKSDRVSLVAEMVEKGETTDESRKRISETVEERVLGRKPYQCPVCGRDGHWDQRDFHCKECDVRWEKNGDKWENECRPIKEDRWLLAVDVSFYVNSHFYAGAGVQAGSQVAAWVERTWNRLHRDYGLSHVVCCFDSPESRRKELTAEWEEKDRYKARRGPKDPEVSRQLRIARELLEQTFSCVSVDGWEADDVMASYVAQFEGKVTLLTVDKDMRQLLSARCNILVKTEWDLDDLTGSNQATDVYVTARSHTEETGVAPDKWISKQALSGDTVDNIAGAANVGEVGAASLVNAFGSAQIAVDAAMVDDERITSMRRGKLMAQGLRALLPRLEVMLQLVRLRQDLPVPELFPPVSGSHEDDETY